MDDLTALVVLVHGSPMAVANADMFHVVEIVRERNLFFKVVVGFMECNEPTIPEAIEQCVAAGAKKIVAVPYFLHVGTHVADDLPTLLEDANKKYSEIQFDLGPYIGKSPHISNILAARVYQTT